VSDLRISEAGTVQFPMVAHATEIGWTPITPDVAKRPAVIELFAGLTVLWAGAGVVPEDVWQEMERREHMLGIAEKLPKSAVKMPKATTPPRIARRPIVALESRALRKRH